MTNFRKSPLLVIAGPTATGKSSLALSLAQKWNMEIISVDALQVYKYLDIGTAKPTVAEQRLVPHHMIDIISPDENYNAGRYEKDAGQAIETVFQKGKIPLLVGGTGLYLKSVLYGFFAGTEINPESREKLKEEAKENELFLYESLKKIDPETAKRLHPHDHVRLIRALEVYYQTGVPISVYQQNHLFKKIKYQAKIFCLNRERTDLYNRIEARVDKMIQKGLVEEIEDLLEQYPENTPAFKGLGYKQMIPALRGEYSVDEAVRLLKRDTRHYAKRQLTWFRGIQNIHWINLEDQTISVAREELEKVIERLFDKL